MGQLAFRHPGLDGAYAMKKQLWMRLAVAVTLLAALAFLGYRRWLAQNEAARGDVLALMPADANAVLSASTDRKSTRLNSSHLGISYAVFCLKKKKTRSENYTVLKSTE